MCMYFYRVGGFFVMLVQLAHQQLDHLEGVSQVFG